MTDTLNELTGSEPATCNRLTPQLAQEIKAVSERPLLNRFKLVV